jgi:hypothetical protein
MHRLRLLCLSSALALLWTSVILICHGTYLQTHSPQWQKQFLDRITAENPGKEGHGAGTIGVGMAFVTFWPFYAMFYGFPASLCMFGACRIHLYRAQRPRAVIGVVVFLLGSLDGYWFTSGALADFQNGFDLLGYGKVLFRISIASLSVIIMVMLCWRGVGGKPRGKN